MGKYLTPGYMVTDVTLLNSAPWMYPLHWGKLETARVPYDSYAILSGKKYGLS